MEEKLTETPPHSPIRSFETIYIPISVTDEKTDFIGRTKELKRFVADLCEYEKGAFLVTGYRGVGKTRFVEHTLDLVKAKAKKNKDVEVLRVSLGNGSIHIYDLLVDMVLLLNDKNLSEIAEKPSETKSTKEKGNDSKSSFAASLLKILDIKADFNSFSKTTFEHTKKEDSVRQIETKLIDFIKSYNKKLIFVFDELDKVSSFISTEESNPNQSESKNVIDQLLGSMKRLFSEAKAPFVFIAGRDILDAYHSEVGNTDALYEHLFKQIYYVPSLMRDTSCGDEVRLSRMIEEYVYYRITGDNRFSYSKSSQTKSDKSPFCEIYNDYKNTLSKSDLHDPKIEEQLQNAILALRNFTKFLTFHTWGNFNKLIRLFSTFLEVRDFKEENSEARGNEEESKEEDSTRAVFSRFKDCGNSKRKTQENQNAQFEYYLKFDLKAMHRIMLASNLYILFYQGVGRQLASSDDRLAVSAFILYHHILKLHRSGFSRKHVVRLSDAISRTAVPRLTSVADSIINVVLRPFIRKSFGGFFQYRFYHHFQQELMYISDLAEIDMATFNFSLEAYSEVNTYYNQLFQLYRHELGHSEGLQSLNTKAKLQEIMGDISIWNKRAEESYVYYGGANNSLSKSTLPTKTNSGNISNLQYAIQVQTKLGYLEELRGDYPSAESFYLELESLARSFIESSDEELKSDIKNNPDKFHMLRNCFLARIFLNSKRSKIGSLKKAIIPKLVRNTLFSNSALLHYKLGIANFVRLDLNEALRNFTSAYTYESSSAYTKVVSIVKICQIVVMLRFQKIKTSKDVINIFDSSKDINLANSISQLAKKAKSQNKSLTNTDFKTIKDASIPTILTVLLQQAKQLEKSGLHTQAAHVLLSYLAICKLFLASIPFRDLKNKDELINLAQRVNRLASESYEMMRNVNLSSYQNAFSFFRASFYNEYTEVKGKSSNFNALFSCERIEDIGTEYHNAWQQSSLEETFMMMRFWLERVQQSLKENIKNVEQKKVLPQGCWSYAISLFISGRNMVDSIIKNDVPESDVSVEEQKKPIYYLVKSLSYLRVISDNDRLITFPTACQISYCIWELLFHLVDKKIQQTKQLLKNIGNIKEAESIDNQFLSYEDAVTAVEKELMPKNVGEFSTRFLNLDFIYEFTLQHFDEIIRFVQPDSDSSREILKNKYYINDDFEDPTFSMFWMYLYSYSAGAKLHKKTMVTSMKSIQESSK